MKRNYVYEEWKDIEGYEGLYQVSNFGRVKSLERVTKMKNNRTYPITERILTPLTLTKGYLGVRLYRNGKGVTKKIHKLVALAFIPNPNNYTEVNHKGENKNKNFVWQLEWCTLQYNNSYGTRIERIRNKCSKIVLQFDLNCEFIKEWPSVRSIEAELGYCCTSIIKCCKGKSKQAYGYIWIYKNAA